MIKIDGLFKRFGLVPVLKGLDLEVAQGEFVSLVGPNGAGKTTLMRIVATLSTPSDGSVTVGGWPLPRHASQVRPHIGLVSHQPLLYNDLTATENLAFFARLYGQTPDAKTLSATLRRVGLAARARDTVGTFSRGMIQRLTIARATLHEPDILLLDEPYTGLDQEAGGILDELLRQEKAAGRTIMMITHDLLKAHELSHRVAILQRGRIRQEVVPTETPREQFLELYATVTKANSKNRRTRPTAAPAMSAAAQP